MRKQTMYYLEFRYGGDWIRAMGRRYSDKKVARKEAKRRTTLNRFSYRIASEAR